MTSQGIIEANSGIVAAPVQVQTQAAQGITKVEAQGTTNMATQATTNIANTVSVDEIRKTLNAKLTQYLQDFFMRNNGSRITEELVEGSLIRLLGLIEVALRGEKQ